MLMRQMILIANSIRLVFERADNKNRIFFLVYITKA